MQGLLVPRESLVTPQNWKAEDTERGPSEDPHPPLLLDLEGSKSGLKGMVQSPSSTPVTRRTEGLHNQIQLEAEETERVDRPLFQTVACPLTAEVGIPEAGPQAPEQIYILLHWELASTSLATQACGWSRRTGVELGDHPPGAGV